MRAVLVLVCLLSSPGCLAVAAGAIAGSASSREVARQELDAAGLIRDRGALQIGIVVGPDRTVTAVDPGSPAARSGLAVGDRIERIDGVKVDDQHHALYLLFGPVGETVHVVVQRGDKRPGFTMVRRDPDSPRRS